MEIERRRVMASSSQFLHVHRSIRLGSITVESPKGMINMLLLELCIAKVDRSQLVYNQQIFHSMDDFLSAYHNGTLIRTPPRPDVEDPSWATRKRVGEPRDLDHLPGPRSVSFAGLRFRVDKARQYISWMGWGMYLGFDRDMGLSLWDIRLKGERIIYQVCCTTYSSCPPPLVLTVYGSHSSRLKKPSLSIVRLFL